MWFDKNVAIIAFTVNIKDSTLLDITKLLNLYTDRLESQHEVSVKSLVPQYQKSQPSAHPKANTDIFSEAGFEYCIMRLPLDIAYTKRILLTADKKILDQYSRKDSYEQIHCHKRRRLYYYNKDLDELVVGINSVTAINDIIPILAGLLTEIYKLNKILSNIEIGSPKFIKRFSVKHIQKIQRHVGENWVDWYESLLSKEDFIVTTKNVSRVHYIDRALSWSQNLEAQLKELDLLESSVYITMGNSHSIINPLSPFSRKNKEALLDWAKTQYQFQELLSKSEAQGNWQDDMLYYIRREFLDEHLNEKQESALIDEKHGIYRHQNKDYHGPNYTIIKLSELTQRYNDPRIFDNGIENLKESKAYILNVDFTMGGAQARYILDKIIDVVASVKGLYIIGKAGSMKGQVGDIILPSMTYDCYNENFYFYKNDLKGKYIRRYLRKGNILEDYHMLTVYGVLLQNLEYLDYFYTQSLTGIEMEGGPYLSALLSHLNGNAHYRGKLIHLSNIPFDFGIAYYVSDTPYHEGKTLGSLGSTGLESVYALSIAIINRILVKEASIII